MARTPVGNSNRDANITIRVDHAFKAMLDRKRGELSRSDYIRRLIELDGEDQ